MMHRLLSCAIAASSILVLSAQNTLLWGPLQSCGTASQGYLRPRVQVNGSNDPVVIWGRSSPASNFVSVGNGTSFSTPVIIHPMGVVPALFSWMGSSIVADGNTIWAVIKASPEDTKHCYVIRSDDGGYTWGDTLRADAPDGMQTRFPSIAVVPGAGPIVQYMRFDSAFYYAHYVERRMVGGVFQPPVQVSQPFAPGYVCDCCPGQIEASGNTVVGLYRNAGPDIRVIWGGASTDGGTSIAAGAEMDATNWMLNSCPASGPDGYIAGDSVRYVWMSGANNIVRVYLRSAHLPELTPGPQRFVHASANPNISQNYPRIAGSGDTLGVVWEYHGGGNSAILFSHSLAGIGGLSAPDTIALGGVGVMQTPDITFTNGTYHIVWSDGAAGVVRYRSATLTNTTGLIEPSPLGPVHIWPVPADDELFVDASQLKATTFQVMDPLGRVVLQRAFSNTTIVDVRALAPGAYTMRLLDAHGMPVATERFVKE